MDSERSRVSTTISSLPDSIICHILSFLPTEESVRTRVLSTRWKHLFSLVPVLDFECDYPSTNRNPNSTHTSSDPSDRVERFLDFIDWAFNSFKGHPLNKFRFKCDEKFEDSSRLQSWISESIRLGVREINVLMSFKVPQTFPRSIFNCKTLTDLNLCGNFVLDVPDGACLPCVESIVLFTVTFVDDNSAQRLFRCCPVLENVSICLSLTENIQVVDMSLPTLKSVLVIQNILDSYVILLNAPNLEYLEYLGDVPFGLYAHEGFKSLDKAFIGFPRHFGDVYKPLERLFSAVCHVRALGLATSTLEALQRSGQPLPIFRNLTQLVIKVVSSFDLGFMLHLLTVMPNLEVLVVVDDGKFFNQHSQLFPENVPECVTLRLKEVRFEGLFMMEYKFKLVEYFLKNAEVLDTLKIESKGSVENQLVMSTELLTYPRFSRTCKIVLA